MRDLDEMIAEALGEEEREVMQRIGQEPGFFGMAFGLFGGRLGWVNGVLMVAQAALFLGGVWMAWEFFQANDPVTQLRWGLPSAVLLILGTVIKMAVWPGIYAERVLREVKRLELRLAIAARTDRG